MWMRPSGGWPASLRSSKSGLGTPPLSELTISRPPASTNSASRRDEVRELTGRDLVVERRDVREPPRRLPDHDRSGPDAVRQLGLQRSRELGHGRQQLQAVRLDADAALRAPSGQRRQQVSVGAADVEPGAIAVHRHAQVLALRPPRPFGGLGRP
jgi:hypothetical protein